MAETPSIQKFTCHHFLRLYIRAIAGGISLPQASSIAVSGVIPTGLLPLRPHGLNILVSSRKRKLGVSVGKRSSPLQCRRWRSDLKWLEAGTVTRGVNFFEAQCPRWQKIGGGHREFVH
ncbi:hypothetical protein R1flu_002343 [Riccia fluitans]|uniref:Uncharacterized protein n=1 Tax=Riccia fluitans TaxID=41844 RepID=A0ABD1Y5U7_9MARC